MTLREQRGTEFQKYLKEYLLCSTKKKKKKGKNLYHSPNNAQLQSQSLLLLLFNL